MITVSQVKNIDEILEITDDMVVVKNKTVENNKTVRPQLYGVYKLPEVALLSMGNAQWTADFLNGMID